MAVDDKTSDEYPADVIAVLKNFGATKIFLALSNGKNTLTELVKEVGDMSLLAYHLSEFSRVGLISDGYDNEHIKQPENGKAGIAQRVYKLNPVVVDQCVAKLDSFYRQNTQN